MQIYARPLYKLYYPGGLTIGTNTNRWTYDGAGRVKTIPGVITDQTYEPTARPSRSAMPTASPPRSPIPHPPLAHPHHHEEQCGRLADGQSLHPRSCRAHYLHQRAPRRPKTGTYAYDDLDRLISVDNAGDNTLDETFTYAINDNMLSRTRMPGVLCLSGRHRPAPAHAALGQRAGRSPIIPTATCSPTA